MTRFRDVRVVRVLVVGLLCVVAGSASASAWITPAAAECHECCPPGIAPVQPTDCCVMAPALPSAPSSARVTSVTVPLVAHLLPVFAWSVVTAPVADVCTADPPLRSMPVLLRTSVLLI